MYRTSLCYILYITRRYYKMQFIKTLFVALIPLFISIYLNRKYQLADKDRTIVEKQFEIYNLLYLNIARDTLN